jgi:hypothetical protein
LDLNWTVAASDGRTVNLINKPSNIFSSNETDVKKVSFEERYSYCDAAEAFRLAEGYDEVLNRFFFFMWFY